MGVEIPSKGLQKELEIQSWNRDKIRSTSTSQATPTQAKQVPLHNIAELHTFTIVTSLILLYDTMDPNNTTTSEPADSPEPLAVDSPTSLPGETETHSMTPQPPSVSATAAWVEQIELRPQSQITTTTTLNVQSRAVQEMEMDESPPKKAKTQQEHDGPTAKDQKYDRQLRLWGANGQKALEEAHVCLINNGSGAVGVETLKNLVLPGMDGYNSSAVGDGS